MADQSRKGSLAEEGDRKQQRLVADTSRESGFSSDCEPVPHFYDTCEGREAEVDVDLQALTKPPGVLQSDKEKQLGYEETEEDEEDEEAAELSEEDIPFSDQIEPLKPLYHEVVQVMAGPGPHCRAERGWVWAELQAGILLPGPGLVLRGGPATGKTSVLLDLVERSCFGGELEYGSGERVEEELAESVVAYHFCQVLSVVTIPRTA